ncbi:MAG: hydroxymethylpyrimidine/phosphomethylpyrimidine kinase [Gammaproteobacteria bacterium]|nr:hydroxymethylpyrimidine/phosphomethylpyrimidine kinase [Gammaproteobacteria bacterium]
MTSPPGVLVFAGSDPTGGAGIQADIEAIGSMNCHAMPVITCITAQNTRNVARIYPLPASQVLAQAEAVLADMPASAIKIGLLGNEEIVKAIHRFLLNWPKIPVVLDPVLAAGGGKSLADSGICRAILRDLLPLTTLLTPNSHEARALAGSLDNAAGKLTACKYLLITGTHEDSPKVANRLYSNGHLLDSSEWPRLPGSYHGSGCTLASAIAGCLARGDEMTAAVRTAQEYTWQALKQAYRPGQGQALPRRRNLDRQILSEDEISTSGY